MNGIIRALLAVSVLVLSACSSAPTVYHTLSAATGDAVPVPIVSHGIRSLGVGPVTLPTLLDREGMVIRENATTVSVSDTHLWGGQLEDECLNALTQQLQARLPATRVQTIPWELSQTPQYQVVVKLDQFDGILGGNAVLRGVWQLQHAADGKIVSSEPVALVRKIEGNSVGAMVEAQSHLLSELANRIAQGLVAR
jgi:hypothetical protein